MAINTVVLMGRLVADPTLRSTVNGIAVSNFTIAVDRPRKPDTPPKADFIECVAWRTTAEFISNNFHKGSPIALEGKLHMNTRTTENGSNFRHAEIEVTFVSFAGGVAKNQLHAEKNDVDDIFSELDMDDGELPF